MYRRKLGYFQISFIVTYCKWA